MPQVEAPLKCAIRTHRKKDAVVSPRQGAFAGNHDVVLPGAIVEHRYALYFSQWRADVVRI